MRREASVSALAAALLAALGAASPAARAATIVVTSAVDPGTAIDCTLRQAIVTTNNGSTPGSGEGNCRTAASGTFGADDTIHFDPAAFSKNGANTIMLNSNELAVTAYKLTIDATANGNVTIDAHQASRVMYDNAVTGGLLTLNHLTLTNGKAVTKCGGFYQGGGICVRYANLAMNDSTLSGNSTGTFGGFGGAIRAQLGGVTLTRCTLTGNAASNGGAIASDTNFALIDSTLSGNSALQKGGAIYATNGGVTLTNSTLHGNSASNGGALHVSIIFNPVTLAQVTIAGNSASVSGGGLFVQSDSGAPIVSKNNLFAVNSAVTSGANIAGPSGGIQIDGGGNLVFGAGTVANATFSSPIVTGNPNLGPLQNNGGSTPTMLPKSDSAAINAASCLVGIDTDQRGITRPQPQGGTCDIGAVELTVVELDRIFADNFDAAPTP